MDSAAVDVAVIGAGISGLSCAFACQKLGMRVLVLEAATEPGGCIKTVRSGAYLCEGGPQNLVTSPVLNDLVEALGFGDKVVTAAPAAKRRYVFTRHGMIAVPTSPPALLFSPLLSVGAKWRLAREPFVARRKGEDDESIASFVERRVGREIVDTVVGPFVAGLYAGDPEKISVRSAFPALEGMERDHGSVLRGLRKNGMPKARPVSISFANGNAMLPLSLAAALGSALALRSPVERIEVVSDGAEISVGGDLAQIVHAKRVVIAVSAATAARLLETLAPVVARELAAIDCVPVAQAALAYPRAAICIALDGFGFLATRDAGVRILGAVWNSAAFPNRGGPDEVLVTAFVGGALDRAVMALTDEEVVAIAHADLCKAMNIAAVTPRAVAGFRWDAGIPQYNVGHDARLRAIDAGMEAVPTIALCGNYLRGISVTDCARQARELALRLSQAGP